MARRVLRNIYLAAIVVVLLAFAINAISSARFENQTITVITNDIYYTDSDLFAKAQAYNANGDPKRVKLNVQLLNADDNSIKTKGSFQTDETGNCDIKLPLEGLEGGEYILNVEWPSGLEKEGVKRRVQISDMEKSDLTVNFDKGIYKPGDEVLFRILVTSKDTARPVRQDFKIQIHDGNDNMVYSENVSTSEYGIISGRFPLADEVNSGTYRLVITNENSVTEASFEVEPYILPKFEVKIDSDKNDYVLGDEVSLTISAKYFFGEAVSQGTVSVNSEDFDEEFKEEAPLDENGEFTFKFRPGEAKDYEINVEVTDNSNYMVTESKTIQVASDVFTIELLPENQKMVRGLSNDIYIFTRKNDGSPVKAYLQLTSAGFNRQIATDENGIGKFTVEGFSSGSISIDVQAADMDGNIVKKRFELENVVQDVIIRADKAKYNVGETIKLRILGRLDASVTTIYAYKNDRLLNILSTVDDEVELNLGDTYGIIDIYAVKHYPYARYGEDSPFSRKTIFIDPGKAMLISLSTDKAEYRPGENVNMSMGAADSYGRKLDTAFLVSVVDEAVLNLAANDLSIDNIKLALADIKFSDELDAATLYASIISNASEQAIMGLLLRQESASPSYVTISKSNENNAGDKAIVFLIMAGVMIGFYFLVRLTKIRNVFALIGIGAAGVVTFFFVVFLVSIVMFLTSCSMSAFAPDTEKSASESPDSGSPPASAPAEAPAPSDDAPADYEPSDSSAGSVIVPPASPPPDSGAPLPAPAPESEAPISNTPAGNDTHVVKVRNMFLETMLFAPEVIAKNGDTSFDFLLADNITTWNIQVVGNSKDGVVGYADSKIRAFQPFFVDFELPKNSIRHDEISIPVTVFNYTDAEQSVILTIKEMDWFSLGAGPVQSIIVPSNQSVLTYVPIKIEKYGDFVFRADAAAEGFSDAAEKAIKVNPEGYKVERLISSGTIYGDTWQHILFMQDGIDDTRKAYIRLYPSPMSQLVAGIENIFRMPTGCFEQVSSSLYPNILALRYMEDKGIIDAGLRQTALEYIMSGYQKLLAYEVKREPGGFSLYGDAPAETVLTAYGLMQFKDLSSVYEVDGAVLERMKEYLFWQQNRDGSFDMQGYHIGGASSRDRLALDAYIIWALSESYPDDARLYASVDYLKQKLDSVDDNYTLALIANVLINVGDAMAQKAVDKLASNVTMATEGAFVTSSVQDYYGSQGLTQDLQTTALTSLALSKQRSHSDINKMLIDFIISSKDPYGTWHSTQATILCLKALIGFSEAGELSDGQIAVSVGETTKTIDIKNDNRLDLYQLTFEGLEKENIIDIKYPIEGKMVYEIVQEYYVPYESAEIDDSFEIISSIESALSVNEAVTQNITIINWADHDVSNAMVVVSIPQGFRVDLSSLESLRNDGVIAKYETKYETINLYLRDFQFGEIKELDIRYRPGYPANITAGQVRVYDYYNPYTEGISTPNNIIVQ